MTLFTVYAGFEREGGGNKRGEQDDTRLLFNPSDSHPIPYSQG